MSFKKTAALLLAMSMALSLTTGCAPAQTAQTDAAVSSSAEATDSKESKKSKKNSTAVNTESSSSAVTAQRLNSSEAFSDRDRDGSYEESDAVSIFLDDGGIQCSSPNVKISGTTASITSEGVYLLTGSLENGQIIVDADSKAKVQLVLRNAELTSKTTAPIYIRQADKVFLTLEDGTKNLLSTAEGFEADGATNVDGVVFSKADLTINGGGSLTVASAQGHGIVSKDKLTITGGELSVNAAGHALSGKDCVSISGGVFTLNAGKDCIHSENTEKEEKGFVCITGGEFHLTSDGDGMDASSVVQIEGGSFELVSGGGSANAAPKAHSDFRGGRTGKGGMAPGSGTSPNDSAPVPPDGENIPSPAPAPGDDMPVEPGKAAQETASDASPSTKGIKSDTGIFLDGGVFVIDSADDSIHSKGIVELTGGEFTLSSGDDGIHGESGVTMSGGTVDILTSYEGVEGNKVAIQGGTLSLVSSDDGLNVSDRSGELSISGGTVHVNASGDGIDSNGDFAMTGGLVTVSGPTNAGNGGIDYDGSGIISGGTLIALCVSTSEQVFSEESTQGSILLSVAPTSGAVSLADETGKVLAEFAPEKEYSVVLVSCPELKVGSGYTLKTGDASATVTMDVLQYGASDAAKGFGGRKQDFGSKDGADREGGRFDRKDKQKNRSETETAVSSETITA